MLRFLSPTSREIKIIPPDASLDNSGVWYDLFDPSPEEIQAVEKTLPTQIPSYEEMLEIETSSRFYQEGEFHYMTVNLITSADSEHPVSSPVTFILNENRLITVRYVEPKPFLTFTKKAQKNFKEGIRADQLFLGLLEMIVDRIADIIEMIGVEIDIISHEIFKMSDKKSDQRTLKEILAYIGRKGDLSTDVRLSLENINRLLKFITSQVFSFTQLEKQRERISILQQDVNSITDHISFLFNKINFLLDATLGLINIEQNAIVKTFSVAAVIFLPPTLIASIYGMNFAFIPELQLKAGYPLALFLMIISAVLPYLYFKRKGWLH